MNCGGGKYQTSNGYVEYDAPYFGDLKFLRSSRLFFFFFLKGVKLNSPTVFCSKLMQKSTAPQPPKKRRGRPPKRLIREDEDADDYSVASENDGDNSGMSLSYERDVGG